MSNAKTPITFRLYATIRFDRPINPDEHYISPGGYEMTFNGKTVKFDFTDYTGYVDSDDPCLLHTEQKNPDYAGLDYDEFEGLAALTSDDLHHLESIGEFFVYTGEEGDPEIVPVALESITFRNFGTPEENLDEDIEYDGDVVTDYEF